MLPLAEKGGDPIDDDDDDDDGGYEMITMIQMTHSYPF